jgi:putative transposase
MIRCYKRKLILTKEQSTRIVSWIGACRVVYNLGLEIKIAAYRNQGRNMSTFELMRELPELKREYEWIGDVPSQSLQAVLERLEHSYQTFFRGGGFPHWASKRKYRSIHLKSVKVCGNSVIIPKMGVIRMFKDAPIKGTPKTAQIVLEPTGLFICIQCELPDQKLCGENQAAVGIDMGIAYFCILSDGNMTKNPRHFKKYERKLRIAGRSLARKKKGSKGWKRQTKLVALLYHRIANVRKDFLHKESTRIARGYATVFVEDLNIKGMSKNRQLSRHILDCGWGMFINMLEYKTNVVKVNARYTSQTCHLCGAKDAKSRISQSEFNCTSCGHKSHADVNASKNIMSRGAALLRKRNAVA